MNNNYQNEQQESPTINCAEQIGKLPFWTRVVFFSLGGTWLLDLLTNFSRQLLASSVSNTFWHYRLWTLFTASFYVDSLFFAFVIIYNFYSFLPKLQQRISTSALIVKYLINGAIIQLLTLTLQYFVLNNGESKQMVVNGVGGIWFCMVYKYCYYNGERQIKFCCFNFRFTRKVYPFVLLAVCCLLSFRIPLQMVVGLLYGLLQVLAQKVTSYPSKCLSRLSTLVQFGSIQCWIRQSQTQQNQDYSDRAAYQHLQLMQGNTLVPKLSPQNQSVAKDPFANKKAYRIGDY